MMPIAVILTLTATVTLLLAGYLVGARRGRAARAALDERIRELETERAAAPAPPPLAAVKEELQATIAPLFAIGARELQRDLRDAVAQRDQEQDAFREELRGMITTLEQKAPDAERLQRDLVKSMSSIVAQRTDGSDVRKVVDDLLGGGRELSSIVVGAGGLGELPKLVDAITKKGGFASVVLSDEAGLPLAASDSALDVEGTAEAAAFFLTLAERSARAGHPRPIACVIMDDTNRLTLHRIFNVQSTRFTVSAVARGKLLVPGALDGALAPLERVLAHRRDYSRTA
jgi:hypothetical protein